MQGTCDLKGKRCTTIYFVVRSPIAVNGEIASTSLQRVIDPVVALLNYTVDHDFGLRLQLGSGSILTLPDDLHLVVTTLIPKSLAEAQP